MLKKLFSFVFFIVISFEGISQNVKRAYKFYEKNDLVKVREVLMKMEIKSPNNPGKLYLYSLYHLTDSLVRSSIDSAHIYILKSKENIDNVNEKESAELLELNINKASIDSLEDIIDRIEFQFVLDKNTVKQYAQYMLKYPSSTFYLDAEKNRNTLEYTSVEIQNTWQAYKVFLDKYPYAEDAINSKSNYDRLLFKEKTRDGELKSYELFLEENPLTPYKETIEKKILIYYSIANQSSGYIRFLKKYTNSIYNGLVTDLLYHVLEKNFSLLDPKIINPKKYDSLSSLSEVDKIPVLGFYEDEKIGFMDSLGNTIFQPSDINYVDDVLCSFTKSDFFIIEKGELKSIINRNKSVIYSGIFSSVEDMGMGIIKVITEGEIILIHKSGYKLFPDKYEDAYLVDKRFILLLKDGKYGLFSILGKKIYDFIFDDVFQEGSFILFQKEDLLDVSNSLEISNDGLFNTSDFDFSYVDYEYFDSGFLLLFTENQEELIDESLNPIIPRSNQIIDSNSFGWTAKNEYGIKIFTDIFDFPFSTIFDNIKYSSLYFAEQRDSEWNIYSIVEKQKVASLVDSLFFITDSIIWYKKGITNNIIFPNKKEVELHNSDEIFLMTSPLKSNQVNYLRISSTDSTYILDNNGNVLPKVEYYHTVISGNTFSQVANKYGMSQSQLLLLNNRKSKKLFVGEKLKIKGYTPKNILSSSLFSVEYEGKKGISDTSGTIILEPVYDGIKVDDIKNITLINNQAFGNYNTEKRQLIKPIYSSILIPITNNYYAVSKDNYYGVINGLGEKILNFEYDKILEWNDTLVIAKKSDSYSIINLKSKNIIYEFDSFSFLREDGNKLIRVLLDGKYGVYSSEYGELLTPKYNIIEARELDNKMYFFAKQKIEEALLLINLIIKENRDIIKNQAVDVALFNQFNCSY